MCNPKKEAYITKLVSVLEEYYGTYISSVSNIKNIEIRLRYWENTEEVPPLTFKEVCSPKTTNLFCDITFKVKIDEVLHTKVIENVLVETSRCGGDISYSVATLCTQVHPIMYTLFALVTRSKIELNVVVETEGFRSLIALEGAHVLVDFRDVIKTKGVVVDTCEVKSTDYYLNGLINKSRRYRVEVKTNTVNKQFTLFPDDMFPKMITSSCKDNKKEMYYFLLEDDKQNPMSKTEFMNLPCLLDGIYFPPISEEETT